MQAVTIPAGSTNPSIDFQSEKEKEWKGKDFTVSVKEPSDLKIPLISPTPKSSCIYTLRTQQYRYIICPDGGEELYDMKSDSRGWENLANHAKFKKVKKALKSKLEKVVGCELGNYYLPNTYVLKNERK